MIRPPAHGRPVGGTASFWGLMWGLVALLTVVGERLPDLPHLTPGWLGAGLMVVPALRWSWRWTVPACVLAIWIPEALTGQLDGHTLWGGALVVAQATVVALLFKRWLPTLYADRRPLYRVRFAHLSRFLFAMTLPTVLTGGLLVSLVQFLVLRGPAEQAVQSGLLHAGATGLSLALLAPLTWWQQLRAVPWPLALVSATVGLVLPVVAARVPALVWLLPLVAIVGGYLGGVWMAALTATALAASLLVLSRTGGLPPMEGPEGFVVWLMVSWRLLTASLLASLWSERRGRVMRRRRHEGQVHAQARVALHAWRHAAPQGETWQVFGLSDLLPPDEAAASRTLAPGGSLRVRGALFRLSTKVRDGDLVVGVGPHDALILLRLSGGKAPSRAELERRCRLATHENVLVGEGRRLDEVAVGVLLGAAAAFDEEGEDGDDAPASWTPTLNPAA